VRGLYRVLFRRIKGDWQAVTGVGILKLPVRLLCFGIRKHTQNDVFKGTPSEKKNSQDDLPTLAYFQKGWVQRELTYPVRVLVKANQLTDLFLFCRPQKGADVNENCWRQQCAKCREFYIGDPSHGHQVPFMFQLSSLLDSPSVLSVFPVHGCGAGLLFRSLIR
jgi:hypothetical protein